MSEYASKGVAGSGLGLGIAGTALGLLNNGGLGGLFNWGGCGNGCGDNAVVNRYEAGQNARIAELETEVKLRDANFYTLGEMGKMRDYIDRRFERVENELCDQRVYNATNTAAVSCMQGHIATLMGLTKTVVPINNICPEPMARYNSFTVPTATAPTTGA